MKSSPVGNYEAIANIYAESVDTKPIHIFYERPHTWSLLPTNLNNLKVLDIGCGSGWYAEQLSQAGARVTALDASATMVELTKKRLNGIGKFVVANLEEPLDFLPNKTFDIILAPLVIHYIEHWQPLFLEMARLLKKQGLFIFSTHQPHSAYQLFKLDNYYHKTLIKDYWASLNVEVKYYHHTLHELSESLYQAGFVIEKLLEPQPLPQLKQAAAEMFNKIITQPWFLFARARKVN